MLWLTLGIATILTLVWLLTVVIAVKLWTTTQKNHSEERKAWELERERLLNRAMTKEWQSYVQMTTPQNLYSNSEPDVVTMTDDDEIRRYAEMYTETEGVGETLLDLQSDLEELGIKVEHGD